jgi:hypothetical protein
MYQFHIFKEEMQYLRAKTIKNSFKKV